jgi:methionyl-tRNA formyltransferase
VIFGAKTLGLPRLGCINLHASLLPRYRGASPIAAALIAGDAVSGVTLMLMEPGLDTGPIIATVEAPVAGEDTTATLGERLGRLGGELAVNELPRFAAGELVPRPQPAGGASLTRPLTKADGWLDWSRPATKLERRVRALWPWPRTWTTLAGDVLQVHAAEVVAGGPSLPPGRLLDGRPELVVACGRDALRLTTVQPAGGRPMSGTAFLAGRRPRPSIFGDLGAPPPQPALITPL